MTTCHKSMESYSTKSWNRNLWILLVFQRLKLAFLCDPLYDRTKLQDCEHNWKVTNRIHGLLDEETQLLSMRWAIFQGCFLGKRSCFWSCFSICFVVLNDVWNTAELELNCRCNIFSWYISVIPSVADPVYLNALIVKIDKIFKNEVMSLFQNVIEWLVTWTELCAKIYSQIWPLLDKLFNKLFCTS